MPPRWQTWLTLSPPEPSVEKNSMAPITATYGRMGMVIGRGINQMRRSGKRTALAMRMPKIAPEAPMVGVTENMLPKKTGTVFFGSMFSVTPTIGASGAIFGILMANAVLFPDRRIWLIPLPITIPMRPYVAVMGAIEFFSTLGSGGDNVSHVCHLGGMLVGYLYLRRGSFLYNVRNTVTDWQHKRNRKRFEVYINKHKKDPPSRPDNWVN